MFLRLEHVGVRYPGPAAQPAVDDVCFGLARGEIGALIGPSGCGKTSLLRAVAGLEPLAAGRIAIDGEVLAEAGGAQVLPERRRIGMVFQDYALFPHLSVERNVAFGLRKLPRGERGARVAEMLALVGLEDAGSRAPHQLSGGQQQRIALARALAPGPRLLLLDEPFSSLDVDLRARLAHEVRSILRRAGATALFVTHDQQEAFAVADQVGVMQAGRLEQWAAPQTLYRQPATRFVAGFVGTGVLLPARRIATPTGPRLDTALGLLAEADHPRADHPRDPAGDATDCAGRDCEVLVRAEQVLHDEASPLKARLEQKAFHGADCLYTLRLPSGERLLARVPADHDHAVGEAIGIRAAASAVTAFRVRSHSVTNAV